MSAKQTPDTVTLSVRVPAELRAKLKKAAGLGGRSSAKEVARLIDEQLTADFDIHGQLTLAHAKAAACEGQLDRIMQMVLHSTAPDAARDPADQLAELHTRFLTLHARKVQHQRALESQLAIRANPPLPAARLSNDPFAQLDSTLGADATRTQLAIAERRWVNLRAFIRSSPKGTKTHLAYALGWSRSQISQLLSDPNAPGHRRISDSTARKLEQALGSDKGKLDEIEPKLSMVKIQQALMDLGAVTRKKPAVPARLVGNAKE